jgi:hypothetical protein
VLEGPESAAPPELELLLEPELPPELELLLAPDPLDDPDCPKLVPDEAPELPPDDPLSDPLEDPSPDDPPDVPELVPLVDPVEDDDEVPELVPVPSLGDPEPVPDHPQAGAKTRSTAATAWGSAHTRACSFGAPGRSSPHGAVTPRAPNRRSTDDARCVPVCKRQEPRPRNAACNVKASTAG